MTRKEAKTHRKRRTEFGGRVTKTSTANSPLRRSTPTTREEARNFCFGESLATTNCNPDFREWGEIVQEKRKKDFLNSLLAPDAQGSVTPKDSFRRQSAAPTAELNTKKRRL